MATRVKKKTVGPKLPEGDVKLSTNIPADVHKRFKAVAALRGISMKELLIDFADSLEQKELKLPKKRRRKK